MCAETLNIFVKFFSKSQELDISLHSKIIVIYIYICVVLIFSVLYIDEQYHLRCLIVSFAVILYYLYAYKIFCNTWNLIHRWTEYHIKTIKIIHINIWPICTAKTVVTRLYKVLKYSTCSMFLAIAIFIILVALTFLNDQICSHEHFLF